MSLVNSHPQIRTDGCYTNGIVGSRALPPFLLYFHPVGICDDDSCFFLVERCHIPLLWLCFVPLCCTRLPILVFPLLYSSVQCILIFGYCTMISRGNETTNVTVYLDIRLLFRTTAHTCRAAPLMCRTDPACVVGIRLFVVRTLLATST